MAMVSGINRYFTRRHWCTL